MKHIYSLLFLFSSSPSLATDLPRVLPSITTNGQQTNPTAPTAGPSTGVPQAKPTNPKTNNSGFMNNEKKESFSSKVKIVRTIQGETEVFFDSEKAHGAYSLPSTLKEFVTYKEYLEESVKPNGPQVKITADDEKRIQSVEIEQKKAPGAQDIDWKL